MKLYGRMDWLDVVQDRVRRRSVVNAVMELVSLGISVRSAS